jgi:predicted amidohydrolase YtcJ
MGESTRRQFIARAGAVGALALVRPGMVRDALAASTEADTVFRGGPVLTFDGVEASAVAVRSGTIVYVGPDEGAADLIGPATEVIELAGRTLMPGIHDAHNHALYAGRNLRACSLDYLQLTLDQMRERISRCLRRTSDEEPDGWLEVSYWDYPALQPPGTVPTKRDLDVLDTTRPIIVYDLSGHAALANTRALDLAGVTASTPDPPSGEIVRFPDGEPTGLLYDAAIDLVADVIPKPTVEQNAAALRAAIRKMNRVGITSFMDASAGGNHLAAAASLRDAGRLSIRTQLALFVSPEQLEAPDDALASLETLREPYVGGNLQAPTVKLFFDGVIEYPSQTAALLRPYRVNVGTKKDPEWVPGDSRGPTYFEPELADAGVAALDAAGWQVHVHAIGDRAVRTALDAFEHAATVNGTSDRRHTIAHLELVHPDDFPRFASIGALACMQLQWAELDAYTVDLCKPYLGPGRWRYLYPSGSIAGAGGTVTGGSDWPVDPLLPFRQIEMACNRTGDEIYPSYPGPLHEEEDLRRRDALRMHTAHSAFQLHQDDLTGSIAVGKLADVIVLDRDVERVPLRDVSTTQVLMTMVGGEAVYRSPEL